MDALSEVLRLARFNANVTLDATAYEPWCVSVPGSDATMRAHLIVAGEAHVRTNDGDIALRSGEFVFLPRGDAHLIGNPLEAAARSFSSLVKPPIAGELLPVRIGGSGRATRWISLSFSCERHLAQPLMEALPRVVAA